MLLSGPRIIELVNDGVLVLDPLPADKDVNPNSINIRVGQHLRVYESQLNFHRTYKNLDTAELFNAAGADYISDGCVLDPYKKNKTIDVMIPEQGYVLVPGITYIGCTVERAGSCSRYAPVLEGRSTWARLGFKSHACGGWGDVGFSRQWVLEIEVTTPVRLRRNDPVCQVAFHDVESPTKLYTNTGRYAEQEGPQAALPLDLPD